MKNTLSHFLSMYQNDAQCYDLLAEAKWSKGYKCRNCGHERFVKGRTHYYRRCQSCKRDESCTAHTIFHKLKFPIHKAFLIIYQLSTMKKGMSTLEISRQFGIHQQTAWYFKRKLQSSMAMGIPDWLSSLNEKLDESILADQEVKENARIANQDPIQILDDEIDLNERKGQRAGKISESKKRLIGKQIKMLNGLDKFEKMMISRWLKGIHHQVSLSHIRHYLAEFYFKYERRRTLARCPKEVLAFCVIHPHLPYKSAIAK